MSLDFVRIRIVVSIKNMIDYNNFHESMYLYCDFPECNFNSNYTGQFKACIAQAREGKWYTKDRGEGKWNHYCPEHRFEWRSVKP